MFGRGRLRPRLGDAPSRDGCGRRALSRCAFGRGHRRLLAPVPQHVVSASVAPEPRRIVCVHTWGGRLKPDACVRSLRDARSLSLRAFGSLVADAVRLTPLSCSYHTAARTSPCSGLCRLLCAHDRIVVPTAQRMRGNHRARAASSVRALVLRPRRIGSLRAGCTAIGTVRPSF